MNRIISNKLHLLLGILFLLPGFVIYALNRPSWQTPWFPIHLNYKATQLPWLFDLCLNLPSFFHAASFILLLSAIVAKSKKHFRWICIGWCIFCLVFEILQMNFFTTISIPEWFVTYSLQGVFDMKDVVAICVGGYVAYVTLVLTQKPLNNKSKTEPV